MTLIDYTKMRKGHRPHGGRKIEVCPKCGRKGLPHTFLQGKVGQETVYDHYVEDMGWSLVVRDSCRMRIKESA